MSKAGELPNQKEIIRTRTKHKHLEEHYDEQLDEMLPENHHRGDIVSSNRMLAYSDAVMATCATFLVLPFRNLKVIEELKRNNSTCNLSRNSTKNSTFNLNEYYENNILSVYFCHNYTEFIMFFIGFLIVLSIWENMNIRSLVIKRVDDFILTLVIFEMLLTSFLPFSLALQGHYPDQKSSIIITCVVLGILQIIDIGIVLYSLHSPKLLHIDLKVWSQSDLQELTLIMVFRPLISFFIVSIGGALCIVHYGASWACIGLLTLMPTIRKFYWYMRRRMNKFAKTTKDTFLLHFSKGSVPKERVEIMSDAAVAVVACIVILDITVEEFPKKDKVKKEGLNNILSHMQPEFLTFLGTFCLVSALWYINHTVLHLFKTVNSIALYFQKLFLVFGCLCPLAGTMLLKYATKGNYNSTIAIRFSALIVFFSSLANFFMLLYGLSFKTKFLHDWASWMHLKTNKQQHFYTLVKTLNIPFWSLICTFSTLGSSTATPYILYVTVLAVPCSFFVSKIVLMNHVGKAAVYFTNSIIRKLTSKKIKPTNNKNELAPPNNHTP
ncbi:endosomal/lysosomal proton channel TMEM175-like [Hydra vulgaris]|uniref:endosomal/lysosomal proton channel TMEM175-like n=1 Tax=Hydra vulgaris TaxID=6087 RepID=UPI0032E9CE0C